MTPLEAGRMASEAVGFLELLLPMAKGWSIEHPVGSNAAYVRSAEAFLMRCSASDLDVIRRIHAIPLGDKELHSAQETCWCHPTETEPNVIVHNAADCREAKERVTGDKCSDGWVIIAEFISHKIDNPHSRVDS